MTGLEYAECTDSSHISIGPYPQPAAHACADEPWGRFGGPDYWVSQSGSPHWLLVDLQAMCDTETCGPEYGSMYDSVEIQHGISTGYSLRDFDVQVSDDGDDWTTVVSVEDHPTYGVLTFDFEATDARYVRLYVTEVNGPYDQIMVWGFKVFLRP